jgi:hypothetical protein
MVGGMCEPNELRGCMKGLPVPPQEDFLVCMHACMGAVCMQARDWWAQQGLGGPVMIMGGCGIASGDLDAHNRLPSVVDCLRITALALRHAGDDGCDLRSLLHDLSGLSGLGLLQPGLQRLVLVHRRSVH